MPTTNDLQATFAGLRTELQELRGRLIAESDQPALLAQVHANYAHSARNLLRYLTLRRHDLRPLQRRLAEVGLSSLGRAESHVLAAVDAVLALLDRLAHGVQSTTERDPLGPADGDRILAEHAEGLLGSCERGRQVRIMVTMPGEAAENGAFAHDLLRQGMDAMRINCAHDDASIWERMIANLRRAEQKLGKHCRVVMDLGGPKLRTGPVEPGPAVIKVRPRRDPFGRITEPVRIWVTGASNPQPPPRPVDACLVTDDAWISRRRARELIQFTDARQATRRWKVVEASAAGVWIKAMKSAYITEGTALACRRDLAADLPAGRIGDLPRQPGWIPLRAGDLLELTSSLLPGRAATYDRLGNLISPASIGCTIPEVLGQVDVGNSVWFDDGKIGGIVEEAQADLLAVRVTHTRAGGGKLQADKGINFPETKLNLPALTEKDRVDLAFVAEHADIVELSFANTAEDVHELQSQLASFGSRRPAIVLKIETRRAFENLPAMLLTAMRSPSCGVMIARGDLAVECGFERLAEVQEEILWICEAAHVPVIWATQVLESLAKDGLPSRAEITDAAMGHRAECVMLNKGPHIVAAVRVLDDILRRMQSHQTKKRPMLRELQLAHTLEGKFGDDRGTP